MDKNELYKLVIDGKMAPSEAAIHIKKMMKEKKENQLVLFNAQWIEKEVNEEVEADVVFFNGLFSLNEFLSSHKGRIDSLICAVRIKEFCVEDNISFFEIISSLYKNNANCNVFIAFVYNLNDEKGIFSQAYSSLGISLIQEIPKCFIKSIGVETSVYEDDKILKGIVKAELSSDDFWVYYTDKRYVKVKEEFENTHEGVSSMLDDKKVYLILGGLGSLGLHLAKYIVSKFNVTIILVGRKTPSDHETEIINNMNTCGSYVEYMQCDLGDKDNVEKLVCEVKSNYNKIDGVFYAAGFCDDKLLINKEKESIIKTFNSKIEGVICLDSALANEQLDFFVMYSSLCSVIGNIGQTDYSFANGFIDAFSLWRSKCVEKGIRSGKTIAFNWPLWKEGGMKPDDTSEKWMEDEVGLSALDTKKGIEVLLASLNYSSPQVIVAYGKKEKIITCFEKSIGVNTLDKFVSKVKKLPDNASFENTKNDYLQETIDYLKKIFSEETKISFNRIDENERLEKYGIDSVIIVNLTRILEKQFGNISKTLFYEYQTISQVAGYFVNNKAELIKQMFKLEQKNCIHETVNKYNDEIAANDKSTIPYQKRDEDEEFAIIGISGKYPLADDIDEFWKNLSQGRDCIIEIPKSRFDIDEVYSDDKNQKGSSYSRWGGFINGVDEFDPLIFNMSPREAVFVDPQERLFLENAWHTFEDAGYPKRKICGKKIGVFVGVMYGQYQLIGVEESAKGNNVLGNSSYASIANRVSFYFDLHGPSMAIDTMCSSSLTSIHIAINSLKNGECDMALAGGVNLTLHKSKYIQLSAQRFASSNGKCMSFGKGGDGYVPGEGIGSVLLKPLNKAIEDNDNIYAVIKTSAINHGGRTNGYTVPNPVEQGNLIKEAIEKSQIYPSDIGYIEAHGTGTSLGDPIEITGLMRGWNGNYKNKSCAIGSVKSNIGHLESAAGIAALTKVVLQLKNQQIVPSIHSAVLNPNINFDETPFYVPQKLEKWNTNVDNNGKRKMRIAGISAFGAGGSNVHLIVSEYNNTNRIEKKKKNDEGYYIIFISAQTKKSLLAYVNKLKNYIIKNKNNLKIEDISYTLLSCREVLKERMAFGVEDIDDLINKLDRFEVGEQNNFYYSNFSKTGDYNKNINENINMLAAERDYEGLCLALVNLKKVDIDQFAENLGANIVHLPGYVFSDNRYWLPLKSDSLIKNEILFSKSVENKGIVLKCNIDPEILFMHHKVNGSFILPGAAYIEITYEIINILSIKDYIIGGIKWLVPFIYNENIEKELICIVERINDDFRFTYKSFEGSIETVCAICDIKHDNKIYEPQNCDLSNYISRFDKCIDHHKIYEYFNDISINYGDYFRLNKIIYTGVDSSLSKIESPKKYSRFFENLIAPVNIIDAAFQAAIGIECLSNNKEKTMVPYSIGVIKKYSKIPENCYSYLKMKDNDKFDISIFDDSGKECIAIEDCVVKAIAKTSDISDEINGKYFVQKWVSVVPKKRIKKNINNAVIIYNSQSIFIANKVKNLCNENSVSMINIENIKNVEEYISEKTEKVFFLGSFFISSPNFKEGQEDGIISIFKVVKALIKKKENWNNCEIVAVGNKNISAFNEMNLIPFTSAVYGFLKSFAKEYPKYNIRCYDLYCDNNEVSDDEMNEVVFGSSSENGEEAIFRNKKWYRRTLIEYLPEISEKASFRHRGTYVIVGGAGGIGSVLCKKLTREYNANVILIGRRELSKEKFDLLYNENQYGTVEYIRADIADYNEISNAVHMIREKYGSINGVIHSAIVLDDHNVITMNEDSLRKVLSPKMKGAYNLYESVKNEKLDFIMFFSSAQSFTCNPSQSNYSAACSFKDAFAKYIENSGMNVKIMNWGYWGQVGVVASKEYNDRLKSQGIFSIAPQEGMKAVDVLLNSGINQVMYLKANEEIIKKLGISNKKKCKVYTDNKDSVIGSLSILNKNISDVINDDSLVEFKEMKQYLVDYLILYVSETKLFSQTEFGYTFDELFDKLKIEPMYNRLFSELLEILIRNEYLTYFDGRYYSTEKFIYSEIKTRSSLQAEKNRIMETYSSICPQMRLLGVCLENLEKVMKGKILATEVIFPNTSMELVDGIYKGNEAVDNVNKIAELSIIKYIESKINDLKPGEKIEILEIGSGTGGTSSGVLRQISKWSEKIEYNYTDISLGFINYGKRKYGNDYDFMKFDLLDIEKDVKSQGFESGKFDIVLAANVIHATKNLNNTLKNVKYLLKRNGWFVLNEATQKQDFLTLTFGLTSGWWLYEDEENRLKNAPLLDTKLWTRILEENGFVNVNILGDEYNLNNGLSQNIIVSESNGIIEIDINDNAKENVSSNIKEKKNEAVDVVSCEGEDNAINKEYVQSIIENSLYNVLQIDGIKIDIDTPFNDLGVDSIMAVEIINLINEKLNISLNPTDLFNYATIEELTNHICASFSEIIDETSKVIDLTDDSYDYSAEKNNSVQTIKDLIKSVLEEVLQINATELDDNLPFTDFGVDSVMAVEIIRLINERLDIDLQSVDIYNYSSIETLACYISANFYNSNKYDKKDKTKNEEVKSEKKCIYSESDVAVIGVSGYFPDADDIDEMWENLCHGKNSVKEIKRWNEAEYFSENRNDTNRSYSKWGGFLNDISRFDPHFFSISPKEAEVMDPQQRLFLMEAWKAFEDAGYTQSMLDGKNVSVYVGCGSGDFRTYLSNNNVPADAYSFMGNDDSILASRLSYLLNFKGESIAVNTACSSSLLAIHMACESIRSKRSEVALAGGVTVLTTPEFYIMSSRAGMLSSTGKCRAFDQNANGFVPGEGVGAVVLKNINAAIRDHDHIYAVIKGSGTNQDGRTNGITAPSAPSQTSLITEIYNKYNIDPKNITYVETHGTGTKLGDPIEMSALTEAFKYYTNKTNYCAIGSVKTNIGHTLSAAGISSFIKTVLCLKNKMLVPSLNFDEPNEYINFKDSPFYVNTECVKWNRKDNNPLQAAVSSFGFSGTNVHLVVEEFNEHTEYNREKGNYYPFMISTKNKKVLKKNIEVFLEWLENNKKVDIVDLSYTLALARNHFQYREAWCASSIDELISEIKNTLYNVTFDAKKVDRLEKNAYLNVHIVNRKASNELKKYIEQYINGVNLDFSSLYNLEECQKVILPSYSFNLNPYWPESCEKNNICNDVIKNKVHPLVDSIIPYSDRYVCETFFTGDEYYMKDHIIDNKKFLLGVAYIEMARASSELLFKEKFNLMKNITFIRPFTSDSLPSCLETEFTKENNRILFRIQNKTSKSIYTEGEVLIDEGNKKRINISEIIKRCPGKMENSKLYSEFENKGIYYGESFRTIEWVVYSGDESIAKVVLPQCRKKNFESYVLHPSIMDSALHSLAGILSTMEGVYNDIYLPFHIGQLHILDKLTDVSYVYAIEDVKKSIRNVKHFNICIADSEGNVKVIIDDFSLRNLHNNERLSIESDNDKMRKVYFKEVWREKSI